MIHIKTLRKQSKDSFFLIFLLLTTACSTTPTANQINLETDQMLSDLKKMPQSNLVKDELKRAEANLSKAKDAYKTNKNIARLLAEKAHSDVEYAKAKIDASVYKGLAENQEKSLKMLQEMYKKIQSQ